MNQPDVPTNTLVKKRSMWWLLIPLGILLLIPIIPWLVLLILDLAGTKTLSSAPTKLYAWDKVEVSINSQLTLGLGSAGSSEYLLSLKAAKAVSNCTGKRIEPNYTQEVVGDQTTITLHPTLTGGTCKASGFSGGYTPTDSYDPRQFSISLGAISKQPHTVIVKEGDKESRFQLSATSTKIKVTPLSADPQRLIFSATEIDKNPDWIFGVFSPTKFAPVLPDRIYQADGKPLSEDSGPSLILPSPLQRYSTNVGQFLQHGDGKGMLYYQLGWPASGTDDVKTVYKEIQALVTPAQRDHITVVQYLLDGTTKQWPATPELKVVAGAAAYPSPTSPNILDYWNTDLGLSFSYPDNLILNVEANQTTLNSSDIADRLTISEDDKVSSVDEAKAHVTDVLDGPFVQVEEQTVGYGVKAYVWESALGGRAAMELIIPSLHPTKSTVLYFENYDQNADIVWNLRNKIVDSLSLIKN